tara:strand:+ start:1723 stop:2577 length:855 start_codon:yes stop_codon:yes gene_type:complete
MTQKTTTKLPNPEGVNAGGTATFRIPVGKRIHSLLLAYDYNVTTQNVADFEEIRIFVNGQVIQRFTGTDRDTLNQFDGRGASLGILEIPFDRRGMLTLAGREETAINTGVADKNGIKISSMYMEIDLNSGMTITADDMSLYALQSDALAGGAGTIPYIRREQRNPAGADTDFQISDLVNSGVNAPDKIALGRITFVPSTGSISNLKIDRNQYNIFDRTDALNRAMQGNGIKTAQSGYYTIDPTERGVAGEVINLMGTTDYRYRLGVSAAMTLTCISEYLGVLNG